MSLLNPQEDRSLYTEALTTPAGYAFDHGLALTYSLDLDTLLSVPLHLLLYAWGSEQEELLQDRIALLDALRRTADRLSVFHQRGRILEPRVPRTLFALLEESVYEAAVSTPGGSFHPKLWLLRFEATREEERPLLRCLVLSRNLTPDRSWDVALRLEGHPGKTPRPQNQDLVRLLRRLPELCPDPLDQERRDRLSSLAEEVERVEWQVPQEYSEVRLHVLGLEPEPFRLPASDRLLVISPFCTRGALSRLADSTGHARALISLPEELLRLVESAESARRPNSPSDPRASPERGVLDRFSDCFILEQEAEREDGEEGRERWGELEGLHAKIYLLEQGERTRLFVGSANATHAALESGRNIEILAELEAPRSVLGGAEEFLGPGSFGDLLFPFDPADVEDLDPAEEAAEDLLDRALDTLAAAALTLRCEQEEGCWSLVLETSESIELPEVGDVHSWPITVPRDQALDSTALLEGRPLTYVPLDVASLTRFIAFRITEPNTRAARTFVLRLPIEGLPVAERQAAVTRQIIRNQDGFLRYLLFLLGQLEAGQIGSGLLDAAWRGGRWRGRDFETLPLLEEMTRAYCREPSRLNTIRKLIEDLTSTGGNGGQDSEPVVPEEFLELWSVFEEALAVDGRLGPDEAWETSNRAPSREFGASDA